MTELLCRTRRIDGSTAPEPKVVAVKLDLLSPGIEVGLVTYEPLSEFAPVPGMGWMFVADPDGNHIELFGTL